MNKQLLFIYLFCTSLVIFLSINSSQADCTGRDIIFTNITVTSISEGNYQYSYTIKNIGTEDIELKKLSIQNYVSTDDQVGGDAAGGGAYINNTSSEILSPGETYNGVNNVYPFPANPQSSYPYIIAHVYISMGTECDETNNYIAALVEVTTAITKFSPLANATIDWMNDSKSFTVRDWQGNNTTLTYNVYTISGILMLTGNAQKNESIPLNNLQNAYYILHLSDGEKMYSKKIVY